MPFLSDKYVNLHFVLDRHGEVVPTNAAETRYFPLQRHSRLLPLLFPIFFFLFGPIKFQSIPVTCFFSVCACVRV